MRLRRTAAPDRHRPPDSMNEHRKPEKDDAPLTDKEKREAYSVYVAAIGVVIIIASFIWHIVSTLLGGGGNP